MSQERSKLVILTPGFPKDENDSTCLPAIQQFVLALLEEEEEAGNILILSFQYPFTAKEYHWHGIKVISFGGKNKRWLHRILIWIKVYRKLLGISRSQKIRGVLSLWMTECAVLGKFFATRKALRWAVWLQGQDSKKNNPYVKLIRPKAGEVIAISDFSSKEFEANHGIRPFMIAENGLNEKIFPAFNSAKREIDIIGVGSLIEVKNYPLFISVIEEVKKDFPELVVQIAGEGPKLERLRQMVMEVDLQSNITFLGSISHSKVLELMSNAKVLLHTSSYEGNSTVIIEALYSGCKVVSTQGLREATISNLNLCANREELIVALRRILQEDFIPERVVFHLMRDTAKRILEVFTASKQSRDDAKQAKRKRG